MMLSPGTQLGPYEVIDLLGAGRMGQVYRARDHRLHRTVAIKVLPAEAVADPDRRQRFLQEAKTASALNHPNIVHVYDIESTEGRDCLVMEYVEGCTLAELVGAKPLPLRDAVHYGCRLPTRSGPRMERALSTAISSRATSWSQRTGW